MRLIRSIRKRLPEPPDLTAYLAAFRAWWASSAPPPDRVMEAARDLDCWFREMGTKGASLRLPYGTLEWKAHPSAVAVRLAKVGQALAGTP